MEAQEKFGRDVRIIGMPGASRDPVAMTSFVEATGSAEITHIPDLSGSVWEQFDAEHRTYLYINDDGTSRTAHYGNLIGDIEELIAD